MAGRNPRVALVSGVGGQEGAYLTDLLVQKGYRVHGLARSASKTAGAASHSQGGLKQLAPAVVIHNADLTDFASLVRVITEIQPDEIYNLAEQNDVQVSFASPEHTANAEALGVLRLLEAICTLGLQQKTRFYQASTSGLFGLGGGVVPRDASDFRPRSPCSVAKLYAYWTVVNYREAHGLHASNAILASHDDPLSDGALVTHRITREVAAVRLGLQTRLCLGNLDSRRDWCHARDYAQGAWLMLQQDEPGDYVLAMGEAVSVRAFVTRAFQEAGAVVEWEGAGLNEKGVCGETGNILVEVDPRLVRPAGVDFLSDDAARARTKLGWTPGAPWDVLCAELVAADLQAIRDGGVPPVEARSTRF
jgi:GDPmannose 4,6-dehydratase